MKNTFLVLALSLFSQSVSAVTMELVSCWKGFSAKEQAQNLALCTKSLQDLQVCSTNLFEHRQAAFDVCLMEASAPPTTTVNLFKGFSNAQQVENLKRCKSQAKFGQICVTNWFIHGQAAFDVALME